MPPKARRRPLRISSKRARRLVAGTYKTENRINRVGKRAHRNIDRDLTKKRTNVRRLRRRYTSALATATRREKMCRRPMRKRSSPMRRRRARR